ncbi:MAG TPA: glycine cleavage system protein H, partial [Candidatus Polarisedimenticolaceae bacterium]|nr:glycine cleavage system protein H [Candidatus Polarisedimenticolaceae bacterium]
LASSASTEEGMGSQGARSEPTLPCIWMTAGVLAYRLCDRSYDCDTCPLDAALRGGPAAAAVPQGVALTFPDDCLYHRGHGWIRREDEGTVVFGLDALAARLLAPAGSIVLPAEGAELTAGGPACWIREDGELIPVQVPVSGVVLSSNTAVQQDPSLLVRSPYNCGWLLRIRLHRPERLPAGLFGGVEAGRRASEAMATIRDRAVSGMGATLPDGGEVVPELRRVLGIERYAHLIAELLR